MEGVAHFINQEKPDEVSAHIYDFIKKFWWHWPFHHAATLEDLVGVETQTLSGYLVSCWRICHRLSFFFFLVVVSSVSFHKQWIIIKAGLPPRGLRVVLTLSMFEICGAGINLQCCQTNNNMKTWVSVIPCVSLVWIIFFLWGSACSLQQYIQWLKRSR